MKQKYRKNTNLLPLVPMTINNSGSAAERPRSQAEPFFALQGKM